MPQETFVVFINFIPQQGILLPPFRLHGLHETFHDDFQGRLVEHIISPFHSLTHVPARNQFASLQDNAVRSGFQSIRPKPFIENLACENQYAHVGVFLSRLTADVYTHGSRTTKPQIEQQQLGDMHPQPCPQLFLVHCRPDDFRLGNFSAQDFQRAFHLQFYVFHDDYLKWLHIYFPPSFLGKVNHTRLPPSAVCLASMRQPQKLFNRSCSLIASLHNR